MVARPRPGATQVFTITKTHLSRTEMKELGLVGPWFLEFDENGLVFEFRTKRQAEAASKMKTFYLRHTT